MDFEAYHACGVQMDWFPGCIMTYVDKRADFPNSALPVLADASIYGI